MNNYKAKLYVQIYYALNDEDELFRRDAFLSIPMIQHLVSNDFHYFLNRNKIIITKQNTKVRLDDKLPLAVIGHMICCK